MKTPKLKEMMERIKKRRVEEAQREREKSLKRVVLHVYGRRGCPFREMPDPDWMGPPGPVPFCEHPEREKRGGDPWCPDSPNQRLDDPTPCSTPYPPRCPLRDGDVS